MAFCYNPEASKLLLQFEKVEKEKKRKMLNYEPLSQSGELEMQQFSVGTGENLNIQDAPSEQEIMSVSLDKTYSNIKVFLFIMGAVEILICVRIFLDSLFLPQKNWSITKDGDQFRWILALFLCSRCYGCRNGRFIQEKQKNSSHLPLDEDTQLSANHFTANSYTRRSGAEVFRIFRPLHLLLDNSSPSTSST